MAVSTHGMRNTKEYFTWSCMWERCRSPGNPAYKNYGARGITVCARWKLFENFYADMGPKPQGVELDRIDNDKGYSPKNCRWVTRKENTRNRRVTIRIEIDGVTKPATEWAEIIGVDRHTIARRYKNGWRGAQLLLPPNSAQRVEKS